MKPSLFSWPDAWRLPPQIRLCLYLGATGIFFGWANPLVEAPAAVLALPLALFLLSRAARTKRESFLFGWLVGLLGFSPSLYWLYYPIHDVGELPLVLTVPCIMLLGSYLGLFTGTACLAFLQLRLWLLPEGLEHPSPGRAFLFVLLGGGAYGGLEFLSGILFTGFPWFTLATAFIPWPAWVQMASAVGTYGLGALYVIVVLFFGTSYHTEARLRKILGCAGLALLTGIVVFGTFRLSAADMAPATGPAPTFALIQGNVDQNQKWHRALSQSTVDLYIRLSREALAAAGSTPAAPTVDLVVWPETALPFVFQQEMAFSSQAREFARANNVAVAFGTLGAVPVPGASRPALTNRLHILSPLGHNAGYYDKQHLVPFGEYIPFALDFPFLRNILQGIDFSAGARSAPLSIPAPSLAASPLADAPLPTMAEGHPQMLTPETAPPSLALGVLICYEAIFPALAQESAAQGAAMFLTISNDGWFGRTSAPVHHLALSAMRSVEQARPMIRATNSGLTAHIDKYGRILHKGNLFVEETALVTMAPEQAATVYHRLTPFLEIFLALCLLAALCCPWLTGKPPVQTGQ